MPGNWFIIVTTLFVFISIIVVIMTGVEGLGFGV
jgi:hypothetical protein